MDISKSHLYCRMSSYNGKTYKSYSLAKAYRINGKNRREILIKLGKLTDDDAEIWKSVLKSLKSKKAPVPIEDVFVKKNYAYLDVIVLLKIWHFWELEKIFFDDSERDVPLWMVVAALTINRCLDPMSKTKASVWFQETCLPFIFGIEAKKMNPSRIFRELGVIEKLKPTLFDYLYKEIARRDPPSMKSVFYDLTSSTFSGTKCIFMNWGYCKEGYENHIVLALLVNMKGLPIYWQVLPGCTADVTTIEWLHSNLDEHLKISNSTLVFDRGMVSDENLILLEKASHKYISAMDRNQLKSLSDIEFESYSGLTTEEVEAKIILSGKFEKYDESTYYHEVECKSKGRRYILCFNPRLCKDQRNARAESVERFKQTLKTLNSELLLAKKNRDAKSTLNKFNKKRSIEQKGFLEISLSKKKIKSKDGKKIIHSFQGVLIVNEQKMLNAGELDGFWMIVTNHREVDGTGKYLMSAHEVIQPYKEKVVIESSFRDIKSFLDISPIYVWSIEHVKAHYTLCVLAYLLNRTLTLKLHENPGDCSDDIVAHPRLYEELKKCVLNHIKVKESNQQTVGLTQPTEKQIDLLKRIGLQELLKDNYIKSKFMEHLSYD